MDKLNKKVSTENGHRFMRNSFNDIEKRPAGTGRHWFRIKT